MMLSKNNLNIIVVSGAIGILGGVMLAINNNAIDNNKREINALKKEITKTKIDIKDIIKNK